MTMLDRMRRHKAWLKWSLGLVVVTFILLYVPSFMDPVAVPGASPNDPIATVEGRNITVGAYQRAYQQQLMQMRQNYGGQLTDEMIRQLQIPQRVVQQMVDEEATVAAADQLGNVRQRRRTARAHPAPARVPDQRRVHRRCALPARCCANQRPPLRPADFEDQMRRLLSEKLQAAVTGWVLVSPEEVTRSTTRRTKR